MALPSSWPAMPRLKHDMLADSRRRRPRTHPPPPPGRSTRGVAFSFNGGKDSTVLLHIIRAAVARRQRAHEAASGGTPWAGDDLRAWRCRNACPAAGGAAASACRL